MDSDCLSRMILSTEKAEAHFHPARAKACTTSPEVDSGCSKVHRGRLQGAIQPNPRSVSGDAQLCADRSEVRRSRCQGLSRSCQGLCEMMPRFVQITPRSVRDRAEVRPILLVLISYPAQYERLVVKFLAGVLEKLLSSGDGQLRAFPLQVSGHPHLCPCRTRHGRIDSRRPPRRTGTSKSSH